MGSHDATTKEVYVMAPHALVRDNQVRMGSGSAGLATPVNAYRTFNCATAAVLKEGHLVYKDGSGDLVLVTAGSACLGRVNKLLAANDVPLKDGYKAANVAAYAQVQCFADYDTAIICEDADGGRIVAAADYCDILAQTIIPSAADQSVVPFQTPVTLLDSSTANASTYDNETFDLIALDDSLDNQPSASDTTSPRRWRVRVHSTLLQQP